MATIRHKRLSFLSGKVHCSKALCRRIKRTIQFQKYPPSLPESRLWTRYNVGLLDGASEHNITISTVIQLANYNFNEPNLTRVNQWLQSFNNTFQIGLTFSYRINNLKSNIFYLREIGNAPFRQTVKGLAEVIKAVIITNIFLWFRKLSLLIPD